MAFVIAAPEMMAAAAADLAAIGSNVSAAHMVAAARTTSVIPAAADEVSAGIAALFSQHAANYQALAGQAAAFQQQFVQHLTAGAFSYADIEATIASLLQPLTASVGAIGGAIGALPGQLLDLFNLVGQFINDFATGVFNGDIAFLVLLILGAPPFLATITAVLLFLFIAGVLAQLGF
jgi:PE family